MPAALPCDARVGLFGKLPARGDFVREDLPRDFTDPWDAWWQRGLAETQRRFGDKWRTAWLEAPVWRFLLPPGSCGPHAILGLWMPSVDKAGRYSPLTIAAVAAADWARHAGAMMPFLVAAEEAGRDALEHDLSPVELLRRIRDGFVVSDGPTCQLAFPAKKAVWWTDGGPRVPPRRNVGTALPEGDHFAALIDDEWAADSVDTRGGSS
jgi:type VI secretion system protein ImpM